MAEKSHAGKFQKVRPCYFFAAVIVLVAIFVVGVTVVNCHACCRCVIGIVFIFFFVSFYFRFLLMPF